MACWSPTKDGSQSPRFLVVLRVVEDRLWRASHMDRLAGCDGDAPVGHDTTIIAAVDPDTPAISALRDAGIPFETVVTEPAGSPEESARLQGISLHQLIRTIVVRRGADDYVFVLVPGGRRFDWPKLRGQLGVSRLSLPGADEAMEVTGYERGAITPFGSSNAWPVIADASIVGLDRVAIGGGRRGVNIHIGPQELVSVLGAEVVDVTSPEAR